MINENDAFIKELMSQMSEEELITFVKGNIKRLYTNTIMLVHQLRRKWDKEHKNASESECIAQCMIQMAAVKTNTILNLAQGQSLSENGNVLIQDIPSLLTILRSFYELCFIFHNLFITPENDIEREIIKSFWIIRGLQNRQGLANVPKEYKVKELTEKQEIENLRNRVRELLEQIPIEKIALKDCLGILNIKGTSLKGYYFEKSKDGKILNVKSIYMDEGINDILHNSNSKILYRLTSFHTHPSYLGVLQFGQMFNDSPSPYVSTIINTTYFLLATILYDFCSYSSEAKLLFSQIDKDSFEQISYVIKHKQ